MAIVNLNVDGMSCGHCVKSVENAISNLGASAVVNLELKKVTIDFDDERISLDAIYSAIIEQGYDILD